MLYGNFVEANKKIQKYSKEGDICQKCQAEICMRILLDQPKGVSLGLACNCTTYHIESPVYNDIILAQRVLLQRLGLTTEEAVSQSIKKATANQWAFLKRYNAKKKKPVDSKYAQDHRAKRGSVLTRISYGR